MPGACHSLRRQKRQDGLDDLDDLDAAAVAYARRWRRAGVDERGHLRDDLICRCVPFADRIARRYAGRPEPIDDLEQVARLALIKALDRYDPDRGSFTAFAVMTICGEIKRHFRDRTWGMHVYRRLQTLTLEIGPATAELTHLLARDPTAAELARHLDVSEEQVRHAQVCAASHLPVALDAPIDDSGSREFGDLIGAPDEAIEALPDRLAITELLRVLPFRIQRIVALRFYGNLTQAQIAGEIGISQMHVSRLLRHALAWLRTAMVSDTTPPWTGTAESQDLHILRVLISETQTEINVEVIGEVDRDNVARLSHRLQSALSLASSGRVVINLARTPLMDVAGAAVLRDACTAADAAHIAVTVVGVQPLVGLVLTIVGLPAPAGGRRLVQPGSRTAPPPTDG
ncbi:MAG: sigma-70 family RNA polymerase sigma factor [Actinoplanes sp.]